MMDVPYNPNPFPPPGSVQRRPDDELQSVFSSKKNEPPSPILVNDEKVLIAKIMLFIGIGILLIGVTLSGIVTVIEEPNEDDYDERDDYEKAEKSYNRTVKWLFFLGDEFLYIGVFVLITGFSLSALMSPRMNPSVRMGLLIASGLILGLMLSSKPGLLSLLSMF
jgi:hypothetical protein